MAEEGRDEHMFLFGLTEAEQRWSRNPSMVYRTLNGSYQHEPRSANAPRPILAPDHFSRQEQACFAPVFREALLERGRTTTCTGRPHLLSEGLNKRLPPLHEEPRAGGGATGFLNVAPSRAPLFSSDRHDRGVPRRRSGTPTMVRFP